MEPGSTRALSYPGTRWVKASALACFALAVGLLVSSLTGANGAAAGATAYPSSTFLASGP